MHTYFSALPFPVDSADIVGEDVDTWADTGGATVYIDAERSDDNGIGGKDSDTMRMMVMMRIPAGLRGRSGWRRRTLLTDAMKGNFEIGVENSENKDDVNQLCKRRGPDVQGHHTESVALIEILVTILAS